MDAGSTRFQGSLERRLGEVRDGHSAYLVSGSAQDFANYRERVGYLRAIEDVLAICEEIAKEGSDGERKVNPPPNKPTKLNNKVNLYDPWSAP